MGIDNKCTSLRKYYSISHEKERHWLIHVIWFIQQPKKSRKPYIYIGKCREQA